MINNYFRSVKLLLSEFKRYKNFQGVFIFQYGKVASTALGKSIPDSIAQHQLFGTNTNPMKHGYNYNNIRYAVYRLRKHLQIFALRLRKKTKIVTVLRNPIDRNISMFFQDLPYWLVKYDRLLIETGESFKNKTKQDNYLLDAFVNVFPHDFCDIWFEREFLRLTGINVFGEELNEIHGLVLKNSKFDVLLLKYEFLTKSQQNLSDFTGYEVELRKDNVGGNKWYSNLYEDTKVKAAQDQRLKSIYRNLLHAKFYSE